MATASETYVYPTPFATPEAQNLNLRKNCGAFSLLQFSSNKNTAAPVRPALPKQDSFVLARQRLGHKQRSFGRHTPAIGCSPVQPQAVLNRGIKLMKRLLAL
jgi:hypothetical protein